MRTLTPALTPADDMMTFRKLATRCAVILKRNISKIKVNLIHFHCCYSVFTD